MSLFLLLIPLLLESFLLYGLFFCCAIRLYDICLRVVVAYLGYGGGRSKGMDVYEYEYEY